MQWRCVRRPSICMSVCVSLNSLRKSLLLYQTNGWIATKLGQRTLTRGACIQDVLKFKVKVKGHVIPAHLEFNKNHYFSPADGCIIPDQTQSFPNFPFPLCIRFSSASQSPNGCEFAL